MPISPTGNNLRTSSRMLDRQAKAAASPQWITPGPGSIAKNLLRSRLKAFFDVEGHKNKFPDEYREWSILADKNVTPYPPLLELVVDKLRMVSVRRVPNQKYLQNYQKAQFLEPYKPEFDEEAWELIGSESGSNKNEDESIEVDEEVTIIGSRTAVEQLDQHCRDTLSKPPTYTQNIQIATDGSEVYITVVSHADEGKIYGVGSATDKEP